MHLTRVVHGTWLFTVGCFSLVGGVALAGLASSFSSPVWAILGFGLCLVSVRFSRRWSLVLIALACGLIGLWRGSISQQELADYAPLYEQVVTVRGVVSDDIDTNPSGQQVSRLSEVHIGTRAYPARIWVTTRTDQSLRRSDVVAVSGRLTPGFGTFAGTIYNAKINEIKRPIPGDVMLGVRDSAAETVRTHVNEPAASLGIGYLLGQKRALPTDLTDALVVTGLTHIVVASGYNLTILVRLARRLLSKLSLYLAALASVVLILCFIGMTGLSPSMTRAGLVSGLSLWAWYYGRQFHPVTLLGIAMAVTVVWNPYYVWGDLGWALSFAAFGGVMIVAPLMQAYFWGDAKPNFVAKLLVETVAAYIVTLPIILLAFGKLSVIAVVANLVIVPFVPLAMLLVFCVVLLGSMLPGVVSLAALPAEWLLAAMVEVVHWCANIPWAQMDIEIAWWGAVLAYVILGASCLYMSRVTKLQLRKVSIVE